MKGTQPTVLIIILNYGTYDLTLKLIESIHSDLEYNNYEILVVDNCSPNNSAKVLAEHSKKLNYIFIANDVNSGYAAGNNIGLRYAIDNGYQYSWILNNDVELREKDVLKELVDIAEECQNIGCIGPKIYALNGMPCAPYCRRPSLWNMTFGIFEDKRFRNGRVDMCGEVYRVYGCCMLLRSKAMAEIDCMDERTFLYGEESILAERLINKGYKTYYDSNVSVTHKESASMRKMSKNKKKLQVQESEKSREIYLRDYREFSPVARYLCHITRRIIAYLR